MKKKQDLKKSMTASFARHCTFFACHYMSFIFAWYCMSLHVTFFAWRCTSLHVIYFCMSLHIIVCSGYPIFFHVTPSLHSIASHDMTLWIFSYCIIASDCMSTVFASDCTSTVFASDCKSTVFACFCKSLQVNILLHVFACNCTSLHVIARNCMSLYVRKDLQDHQNNALDSNLSHL